MVSKEKYCTYEEFNGLPGDKTISSLMFQEDKMLQTPNYPRRIFKWPVW